MHPKVSICLPVLNARRFLEERMESILGQTLDDWELIACDSYSDDGSWKFLQKFSDDQRVRLYQVPREGLYAGWNECLRRAHGKYVYIATADDTCEPTLLEKLVTPLEQMPEIRIAICDYRVIDEDGEDSHAEIGSVTRQFYGEWMDKPHVRNGKTEFILHAALGIIWRTITAVVFKRDLLDQIGLFRTDRGSQADEEWEMRAALASDIVYVPERLATWRVHANQATARLADCNRTILTSLESVLDDPEAGIPSPWKSVQGWRERIFRKSKSEYYDSFRLYPHTLKKDSCRFMRNYLAALRVEPRWALRRACQMFKWEDGMTIDPVVAAHDLLDLFQCKWPPTVM